MAWMSCVSIVLKKHQSITLWNWWHHPWEGSTPKRALPEWYAMHQAWNDWENSTTYISRVKIRIFAPLILQWKRMDVDIATRLQCPFLALWEHFLMIMLVAIYFDSSLSKISAFRLEGEILQYHSISCLQMKWLNYTSHLEVAILIIAYVHKFVIVNQISPSWHICSYSWNLT